MMNRLYKQYFWSILVLLLSPCVDSESCPDRTFYNWLGDPYNVSSTEECTSTVLGICITSKCSESQTIYDAAIESTGWTLDSCFSYEVGSEGSDDMKCSIPHSDPLFEELFNDTCKIHDICLKTNGRTAEQCNDEFGENMVQKCHMQYPDWETIAPLGVCLTAAGTWYAAVNLAAQHRGGIDPDGCTYTLELESSDLYCNRPPFTGSIGNNEVEIFKFTNYYDDLTVTFTNCKSDFDTKLAIYSEDGTKLNWPDQCDDDDCTSDIYPCTNGFRETPTYWSLPKGVYLLKVTPYSDGGEYSMEAYCNIPSTGSISIGDTVSGHIDGSKMIMYDFTINSPTQIPILFTDCDSDFDPIMYVYDNKYQIISLDVCDGDDCIDSSFNCDNDFRETFTLSISAGHYYIGIVPYSSSAEGIYSIHIDDVSVSSSAFVHIDSSNNLEIMMTKYSAHLLMILSILVNIICIIIYYYKTAKSQKLRMYKPVTMISSDTEISE